MDDDGGRGFGGYVLHGHHHVHPFAWLVFLLLVALLVCGVVYLVLRLTRAGGGRGAGDPPDPLALLRLRYARGELSREDFLQATEDLGGSAKAPPSPA